MKRTTIWLPEDLADRLTVESARTGVKAAELIRRAVEAVTPPLMGELRKRLDRVGNLKVFILSVREGECLVEPGETGYEGLFKSTAQFWVPAYLVTLPESPEGLRTMMALRPDKTVADGFRTNLMMAPGAPVPTTCGICHQPFPSKAAKRRHVRDAHSAPIPPTGASKS